MQGGPYCLIVFSIGMMLMLSACKDGESESSQSPAPAVPYVKFTNGQAASVVIGQEDFVSNGAVLSQNRLYNPYTNTFVADDGALYIPDYSNNRILVYDSIPTINGTAADGVIGQPDFTTSGNTGASATQLAGPISPVVYEDKLYLLGFKHSRVAIYNTVPNDSPGTIDTVLGQPDKITSGSTCSSSGLNEPESLWVVDDKLFVADGLNNRVLIWLSIPTIDGVEPDLVLGQYEMDECDANSHGLGAGSLSFPTAVWSDGNKIVVSDTNNYRILIWNNFPTINGQEADIVLGQVDFFSNGINQDGDVGSDTLGRPYEGLHVANNQIIASDETNHRVLIWNSFPTESGQSADVVIGQEDFISNSVGVTETTLSHPSGVHLNDDKLIVTDRANHRVMIYQGEWSTY